MFIAAPFLAVVLRYEYFHNGQLRWDLGWANPNFGGAFVAMCLPMIWAFTGTLSSETRAAKARFPIGLLIECAACFLLARTQSRGAFLAAVAASLWFHAALGPRQAWRMGALRSGLLIAAALLTDFGSRMAPSFVGGDASVTNRWDVLKGGLQLLASAPVHGWGQGMSGRAYMELFQPEGQNAAYLSLLNGFLTLGVESGAMVLLAALYGVIAVQLASWRMAREPESSASVRLAAAMLGASLLAWWTASSFSNLWIEPRLWILPGLMLAAAIGMAIKRPWLRSWKVHALAAGLGLGGTLAGIVAGLVLGRPADFEVRPRGGGVIELRLAGTAGEAGAIHVWPDWRVGGPRTGQPLKRWARQAKLSHPVIVHYPFHSSDSALPGPTDTVLLFGRQCERLASLATRGCERIILLHPAGAPSPLADSARVKNLEVILPGIDQFGTNPGWTAWALQNAAEVRTYPGIGAYMARAWTDELNLALSPRQVAGGEQ